MRKAPNSEHFIHKIYHNNIIVRFIWKQKELTIERRKIPHEYTA